MVEPITAALGVGEAARNLFGGLVDRWAVAKASKVDATALVRLLSLELQRNLAVLEATIGREHAIEAAGLWRVPAVLQTDVLETVLGQGQISARAFSELRDLKAEDIEADQPTATDILTNLYVRTTSLQALALLNQEASLSKVQIGRRLKNLRADMLKVVLVLAQHRK